MPKTLEKILSPLTLPEFVEKYSYKKAVHIQGAPDKFNGLFDWESLNDLLTSFCLTGQKVKLSKGGKSFSTNDTNRILNEVHQGATLILEDADNVDHSIRHFLNRFSDEICASTRINLYLSFPDKQGYTIHYDTHDIFILQLDGYKQWNVYPLTVESPLFFQKGHGNTPPSKEQAYLNCTLGKGDVLYVPKGHWHEATAVKEPSLHLTLAMFTPTGIDFLNWFVDELREDPVIRRSLPFFTKVDFDESPAIREQLDEYIRTLRDAFFDKLSAKDIATAYYRYYVAKQKNRVPFNFPDQLIERVAALDGVKTFNRLPLPSFLNETPDGKIELITGGRIISFGKRLESLLRFIITREEFSTDDLMSVSGLSLKQVHQVLLVLIREGLVDIRD
jgi:ribosomal protein L16 Arg81 hydroxylase